MKKLIALAFLLAIPAQVFAFIPLLIAGATAGSLLPMLFLGAKVAAIIAYWPLAVFLYGFYKFMAIIESVANRKASEMNGYSAKNLKAVMWSAYVILAISFISLAYYYELHLILAELYKDKVDA